MDHKKYHFTRKQLAILLIAVLALVLVLISSGKPSRQEEPAPNQTEQPRQPQQSVVTTLVKPAFRSVMKDMKLVLEDIKENNLDSARKRIDGADRTLNSVRPAVNLSISLLGSDSQLRKKLEKVQKLLDTADMALAEIALPAIDLLEAYPISGLKVGDGFDTKLVGRYLDFAESVMPQVETVLECANSIDLEELDSNGELTGYLDFANKVMNLVRKEKDIFRMLRSMIGVEEDRLYVLAVQNSVEIRASGGFPGSIGTMRVQDGVLTLGDFKSVTYVMSSRTPKDIKITKEEKKLFGYLSGIQTPRDADLCPDFERVGQIWASAYEDLNREPVHGVISVTPHIVQRILTATGEEVELFDGMIFDGDNAMEVLLHDIYYKYFGKEYVSERGEITDELFADAAEKTMKMLTENIGISQLADYVPILKESFADRTLMVWMKDESEQSFIERMGWSGGLNADPENPEAGVYYNCILASKMGWYFRMDTAIGERTKNEDGSYTYPVTVTFYNDATAEELKHAGSYITGGLDGSIRSAAYFFAPAGGTVSDFSASNGQTISVQTYHGLELGFMDAFLLKPNDPITITYLVTTAPGVETPLVISQTPTARDNPAHDPA